MLSLERASKQKRHLHRRSATALTQNAIKLQILMKSVSLTRRADTQRSATAKSHLGYGSMFVVFLYTHRKYFPSFSLFPHAGQVLFFVFLIRVGTECSVGRPARTALFSRRGLHHFLLLRPLATQVFGITYPCRRAGHRLPEGHHALTCSQGYSLTVSNNP